MKAIRRLRHARMGALLAVVLAAPLAPLAAPASDLSPAARVHLHWVKLG